MAEIKIVVPQFDRSEKLDFDYRPQSEAEFIDFVNKAPRDILYGVGFRLWQSMNEIIADNLEKPVANVIEVPVLGGGVPIEMDIGRGDAPAEFQETDEDVILFPAEWYDVIPDGFEMTSISGKLVKFEKGRTDNDRRFGCLAFGIRRQKDDIQDRVEGCDNTGIPN